MCLCECGSCECDSSRVQCWQIPMLILSIICLIILIVILAVVVPEYVSAKSYEEGMCRLTGVSYNGWKHCTYCEEETKNDYRYVEQYGSRGRFYPYEDNYNDGFDYDDYIRRGDSLSSGNINKIGYPRATKYGTTQRAMKRRNAEDGTTQNSRSSEHGGFGTTRSSGDVSGTSLNNPTPIPGQGESIGDGHHGPPIATTRCYVTWYPCLVISATYSPANQSEQHSAVYFERAYQDHACSVSFCEKYPYDNAVKVNEFRQRTLSTYSMDKAFSCFYKGDRVIPYKRYTSKDVLHAVLWPTLGLVISGILAIILWFSLYKHVTCPCGVVNNQDYSLARTQDTVDNKSEMLRV